MQNDKMSELSNEDIIKVAGGTLNATEERSMDLMIKLFKKQGRKMEEIYQISGLPDEQREYIRNNWYRN